MSSIKPFSIAAAWDRKQLQNDESWIYKLTRSDKAEIDEALKSTIHNKISSYPFSKEVFPLPNFSKVLNQILNILEHGYGLFLIRGLPVQQYTLDEIRIIYAGISAYMGTMMSQNKNGELISDVIDKGEKWGTLMGRGSTTSDPMPFHSDRCDVVTLICINKPKSGGESRVVSSVTIHNKILAQRPDLLETLYKPFYHRRALWENDNGALFYSLPIFTAFDGHFACRFLRLYIDLAQELTNVPKLTKLQVEALTLFEELANDKDLFIQTDFEHGDIQFLNNHVTLHARCPFEDGNTLAQKRHLLRLWLSVPNSRPLAPEFNALFKNTAAGSIRGGAA